MYFVQLFSFWEIPTIIGFLQLLFTFVSYFRQSTEWGKFFTRWFCLSNDWNEKWCSSKRNFMVQKWVIRQSSNLSFDKADPSLTFCRRRSTFHVFHDSVVNIPLSNGRTFPIAMLIIIIIINVYLRSKWKSWTQRPGRVLERWGKISYRICEWSSGCTNTTTVGQQMEMTWTMGMLITNHIGSVFLNFFNQFRSFGIKTKHWWTVLENATDKCVINVDEVFFMENLSQNI